MELKLMVDRLDQRLTLGQPEMLMRVVKASPERRTKTVTELGALAMANSRSKGFRERTASKTNTKVLHTLLMDYCLSYNIPFVLESLPSAVKKNTLKSSSQGLRRLVSTNNKLHFFGDRRFKRRALIAVASADCEFSSLNTPLEPKSFAGKFLSRVLQNDLDYFHVAVGKQLEQLAADRDEAVARMNLSLASDEAALHRVKDRMSKQQIGTGRRVGNLYVVESLHLPMATSQTAFSSFQRIAELREHECEIAVEDVMYMLVLHKFSEIRVHLVPRLSRCIYNGRLEIWPSKDWELESIHNFEVLEMIREHLTAVIGWRADSNVTDNWATTQIPRLQLCGVYAASILYGYFLKSISLRHHLELSVAEANCDLGITFRNPLPQSELWSCGIKNIAFGRISNTQSISVGQDSCSRGKKREKLRRYIMGFDPETLQMRAKPKTKEVVNLVEKHSCALFGDEKTGLIETNEVILTSLSSLKRIVLEAVAFGSFLWDTEEYVDAVYKLKEN
ncbi:hypothetical protein HYC85_007505 [Camellia sinensis]|uniref:Uncharacterized protein n=1 Tax=Camellia sinensis TaxID=4442 RepID=A0A7J7HPR6_CAMSI|nr:hypothetical protein HYC85_007505 [Camellia sinensis]